MWHALTFSVLFMLPFKCWCKPLNWFHSLWVGHNLNFKDLSSLRRAILCWEFHRGTNPQITGSLLPPWRCSLPRDMKDRGESKALKVRGSWRSSEWCLRQARPTAMCLTHTVPVANPLVSFPQPSGILVPLSPHLLLKLLTLTLPKDPLSLLCLLSLDVLSSAPYSPHTEVLLLCSLLRKPHTSFRLRLKASLFPPVMQPEVQVLKDPEETPFLMTAAVRTEPLRALPELSGDKRRAEGAGLS